MPDTPATVRRPPRLVGAPDPAARRLAPISKDDAEAEPAAARAFPVEELPASLPDVSRPPVEDVAFSRGPARRPAPRVADPLLQWASGLPTKDKRIYTGWLVEAGKHPDLEEAMQTARFKQVTIKHGAGNLVTHWAVETANVFVVAEGVQAISEMSPRPGQPMERYGIAFAWRTLPGGRQQSQLRARVYLRELLMAGYAEPLTLTVKGTLTGDLITALTRQYDVLDSAAAHRAASGKPPELPLYAFSIPLGPGAEVTRGSGSATKEITPMVAVIPEPVTKEYLLAHWIKRAWVSAIEEILDQTVAWSIAESAAIGEGEEE